MRRDGPAQCSHSGTVDTTGKQGARIGGATGGIVGLHGSAVVPPPAIAAEVDAALPAGANGLDAPS